MKSHVAVLLTAYTEGHLPKSTLERVKSHLIFCVPCRRHLEELTGDIQALQKLPAGTPPAGLQKEVLADLQKEWGGTASEPRRAPKFSASGPEPKTWAVIGLAGLAAIIVVLRLSRRPDAPPTSTVRTAAVSQPAVTVEPIPTREPAIPVLIPPPAKPETTRPREPEPVRAEPANNKEDRPTSFRVIAGDTSGVRSPQESIISKPRHWRRLWARHTDRLKQKPPLPQVDFDQNEIVAVFAGDQPDGSRLQILKIEPTTWEGDPARMVHYRIYPPDSPPQKGLKNQPYSMILVPRLKGRTFFKKNP